MSGLLKNYRLEIINNHCMPGAMSVNGIAHLDEDVGDAIPYLNAVLGGDQFTKDPPSVTFKVQGKLISVHRRRIAVNALKDAGEARRIVEWMRREINAAWENRDTIDPSYTGAPKPELIHILKKLPRTNCRDCGEPTCLVFAIRLADGAKGPDRCPHLREADRKALSAYLRPFSLDI